jgi:transposase
MDGQSVKTTELGGVRGFDGHKRVKGRKRHIVVDTLGLPIAARVEPAKVSDRRAGARLLAGLSPLFPRIQVVFADAGHESRKLARQLEAAAQACASAGVRRGLHKRVAASPSKRAQIKRASRAGVRGGREATQRSFLAAVALPEAAEPGLAALAPLVYGRNGREARDWTRRHQKPKNC